MKESHRRIYLTGMSGTGKSTVIRALQQSGWPAVDLDLPQFNSLTRDQTGFPDWILREAVMAELIAAHDGGSLIAAGCKTNQAQFYPFFDEVILLTAPVAVMQRRIMAREDNPFGRDPVQWHKILADQAEFEPLLRQGAHRVIDTDRPLAEVVAAVLARR